MKLEVLIATMNQKNSNLLKKMNIQSDAIIGNQCNRNEITKFKYNEYEVKCLSFDEKGVGLNRNNMLMRTTADICILADDDMIYVNNYANIVLEQFKKNPTADLIIFNIYEKNPTRYIIKQKHKVNFRNYMRYGAARITFRRDSICKNGIYFNQYFGGGTDHSAGEDVLFLTEALKKGLKIIAVPIYIAYLTEERESTWFTGYNDKFFMDKGVLFYYVSKRWYKLLSLQFAIRRKEVFRGEKTWIEALKLMLKGANQEKNKE